MSIMKGKFYTALSNFLERFHKAYEKNVDTLDNNRSFAGVAKSINEKNKKIRRIKTCLSDINK